MKSHHFSWVAPALTRWVSRKTPTAELYPSTAELYPSSLRRCSLDYLSLVPLFPRLTSMLMKPLLSVEDIDWLPAVLSTDFRIVSGKPVFGRHPAEDFVTVVESLLVVATATVEGEPCG